MQKTRMFELEYYKIDKSLPDLIVDNKNSGIDLYAREEVTLMPTFGIARVETSNIILPGQEQPQSYTVPCQANPSGKIPLNIIIRGKEIMYYLLFNRSSNQKNCMYLANATGVIDPSYQGIEDEICAMMLNFSPIPIKIKKGQRVAQLLIFEKPFVSLKLQNEHWGSETRGGFGSTGNFDLQKVG